jgi:hypothetical protein
LTGHHGRPGPLVLVLKMQPDLTTVNLLFEQQFPTPFLAKPTLEAAPMTPRSYHSPLLPISTRVRCPVCHTEVYSRAGIHPQCAVRQSEPPKVKKPKTIPGDIAQIDVDADSDLDKRTEESDQIQPRLPRLASQS